MFILENYGEANMLGHIFIIEPKIENMKYTAKPSTF